MNPVTGALAEAARRLSAGSDTPRLDAELLMAEALGIEREALLLSLPGGAVPNRFWPLVDRRGAGEPIAYIIGQREFWNIDLAVGPGALIPRPDSEVLIERAIAHFDGSAGPARVLDLGTGPGTLLLAALDVWPRATGLGIDRSPVALEFATANAQRLGLASRAEFALGDWAAGIEQRFDLILCNPPYVADGAALGAGVREHEPPEALFAGQAGLDAYRTLGPHLPALLAPGGLAAVEIGHDQALAATRLLQSPGLSISLADDLAGRPRALLLTSN